MGWAVKEPEEPSRQSRWNRRKGPSHRRSGDSQWSWFQIPNDKQTNYKCACCICNTLSVVNTQPGRAAVIKYHKQRSLNNRNLLSLSSGGQKCEVKIPAGWVFPRAVGNLFMLLFSVWWNVILLTHFDIPWPVDASPTPLPLCLRGVFPVSVCVFLHVPRFPVKEHKSC